jgi:CDP-diacylglycerol--serine O-phosphatidyltransferase
MMNLTITALFLAIPLIVSGCLHMWVVSKNLLPKLAMPIAKPWFGANKTWRGVVVMMVATIPGVYLAHFIEPWLGQYLLVSINTVDPILLGLVLGFAYALFELPNSYIKRRLNIQPGERSENNTFLFSLMDQADSAIGCAIAYWLIISPPVSVMLWMVLLGTLVHIIANLVLFSLGLRKQPL